MGATGAWAPTEIFQQVLLHTYLIWKNCIVIIQILKENFAQVGALSTQLKLVPFQSSGHGKFCNHANPYFNSNFICHYSDLLNEVYNVFVYQEGHNILSKTCQSFVYLSGIFWSECSLSQSIDMCSSVQKRQGNC